MENSMFMEKQLVKAKIENRFEKITKKWEAVTSDSNTYSEAFRKFIDVFGDLGEAQLARITREGTNLNRDFAITLEPKEDNLKEFNFVLRYVVYNNKTNNGLFSNRVGTVIFGKYDLYQFEELWENLGNRIVGDNNKVLN